MYLAAGWQILQEHCTYEKQFQEPTFHIFFLFHVSDVHFHVQVYFLLMLVMFYIFKRNVNL